MGHLLGMRSEARVFLDGESLPVAHAQVGEALQAAIAIAQERGRMVIEVKADGKPLPESEFQSKASFLAIELLSADPVELVQQSLADVRVVLSPLPDQQLSAALEVASDRAHQALPALRAIAETWQTVHEVVLRCAGVCGASSLGVLDLRNAHAQHQPSRCERELREKLGTLKRCMMLEDWSALYDLLRHDMCELAQSWRVMIDAFADAVATRDPRSA